MQTVFLNGTSASTTLTSSAQVYGDVGGQEELTIAPDNLSVYPVGIEISETIEKVTLNGALSDFTFAKSGTTDVLVYKGGDLVATIHPQTDDDAGHDGTVLEFTSGPVAYTTLNIVSATELRIGGASGQQLTGTPAAYGSPFTVTNGVGADAGKWTVGTQNGNVVVTDDGTNYVFTPASGTPVSIVKAGVNSIVVNTITLTGAAAVLSGETITGTGTVAVTALNATSAADLHLISAATVMAASAGDVFFTGNLGKADVTVSSGTFLLNANATPGTASFVVNAGATLSADDGKLNGVTVSGAGTAGANLTDAIDLSHVTTTKLTGIVYTSADISSNLTLANVGTYVVATGQTLTLIAAQANGKPITDGGNVTVTASDGAQTLNISTTGTNSITPGAGADQVKLGAGTDTVVIKAGIADAASDSAPGYSGVPQTIDTISGFNIAVDKLQLSGGTGVLANGVYSGFTVANGIASPTSATTGDLLISALLTALGTSTNSVAFNAGADAYVIQGNGVADGQISDIVVKLADINLTNLAPILSAGNIIPAPDTTPPDSTITAATYNEGATGDYFNITGANFSSILESSENNSTNIKSRLDWSKFVWDVNGDDGVTTNITFTADDIATARVTSNTNLYVTLTTDKAAAIRATPDYAYRGANEDKLDVTPGFIRDLAGNPSSTDGVIDGWLSTIYTHWFMSGGATSVSPVASASNCQFYNLSNTTDTSYAIDAANVTSERLSFGASSSAAGQTYTVTNLGSSVKTVDWGGGPSSLAAAGNVVIESSNVLSFMTGAGDDQLSSSYVATQSGGDTGTVSSVEFRSGGGSDSLTGGAGDDLFVFSFGDFGNDTIDGGNGVGGVGSDNLYFIDAVTLVDAQFANVRNLEGIILTDVANNSLILGPNAAAALAAGSGVDGSGNPISYSGIGISVMNGNATHGITLNATGFGEAITFSTGSGDDVVTGGSGDDMFVLYSGTDRVNFAATAAENGDDNIYVTTDGSHLTLDFSAFLGATAANTTAVDFVNAGLDLSGASNLGIVFNQGLLLNSDIATVFEASKITVADNGKAVVLSANVSDTSTMSMAWEIYYVEDTDNTVDAQTWAVTLVGQVYGDNPGLTATEIGTINFA